MMSNPAPMVDSPSPTSSAIELVDAEPRDPLALALPHSDVPQEERLFLHWLDGKNRATVEGYRGDLADFGAFMRRVDGTPLVEASERRTPDESARAAQRAIAALMALGNTQGPGTANALVLAYRAHLLGERVAPRTVNRRMAAIRSVLKAARLVGAITWTVEVANVGVAGLRDTLGPGKEVVAAIMGALTGAARDGDRDALRNFAIVRLIYDLGLRRGEVVSLNVEHWEPKRRRLWVWGKKRAEREPMDDVPIETARALDAWIDLRGDEPGALFQSFSPRDYGKRLTGSGVYLVVRELGLGLGTRVRPHGIRHTAITEALDKSGGDIRAVQRFSRHADMRTLQVYDDNRRNLGAAIAAQIAADMPGLDDEEGESE
jgi:integrase/recombinase XerC